MATGKVEKAFDEWRRGQGQPGANAYWNAPLGSSLCNHESVGFVTLKMALTSGEYSGEDVTTNIDVCAKCGLLYWKGLGVLEQAYLERMKTLRDS